MPRRTGLSLPQKSSKLRVSQKEWPAACRLFWEEVGELFWAQAPGAPAVFDDVLEQWLSNPTIFWNPQKVLEYTRPRVYV